VPSLARVRSNAYEIDVASLDAQNTWPIQPP
jgi:hypothetical protein